MDPAIPPVPGLAAPWAVRYASYLMWAGAVLQAAAAGAGLLADGLLRAAYFGIFSSVARWSRILRISCSSIMGGNSTNWRVSSACAAQ